MCNYTKWRQKNTANTAFLSTGMEKIGKEF